MSTHQFKADDGEIREVDFLTMMNAKDGFLEIDGKVFRRLPDAIRKKKARKLRNAPRSECVSDALGFSKHCLPRMQRELDEMKRTKGIRGIDFREDPDVPGVMQVVANTQQAKLRYAAERGMSDRNSRNGSGATLTQKDFDDARDLLLRD